MGKKRIIRVSTYARENNVSTMCVYKRLAKGKLKGVIRDGMKFVEVEDKE